MTSTQLTRSDLITALTDSVPPGRTVLSTADLQHLREMTGRLVALQADAGRQELARFQDLRNRGLDVDRAALTAILTGRVILVTGGTGCIGSSLLAELRRLAPARLVSISRGVTTPWTEVPDVEYLHVDIRESDSLDAVFDQVRPDVVFHLGAQHNPALAEIEVARTYSTNVLGSANVFAASRRHDATVVHASTGKAMRPFSSDVYAGSKKMAEWLLQDAMRDGSLKAATARFTHVVDNSIIYRRLQTWIDDGTAIRLHDPETFFYLQSAREAAQLLMSAATVAARSALPLAAIRDVGMPVSLLDLAIGTMVDHHDRLAADPVGPGAPDGVVPIYICGREPGYDHSVYPGLYDPRIAGDRSPLINAFEADDARPLPACEAVDLTAFRAHRDPGTRALVERLGAAALADTDPSLLRTQADECGWAMLTSVVSLVPTPVLRRQLDLVEQVPAAEMCARDRQTVDMVTWELRRRGEPVTDVDAGPRGGHRPTRLPSQPHRRGRHSVPDPAIALVAAIDTPTLGASALSTPPAIRGTAVHKSVTTAPLTGAPPTFDPKVDVSDAEKYLYFGPQRRWYLVLRFVAFVGLMISLVRFTYSEARISALLVVIVCLAVVAVVSLYTSTRKRRFSMDDHERTVSRWPMRSDPAAPSVDVFLPSAGEPMSVLLNTYQRVARLDYPGVVTVYVLDDSARTEVADLARQFGFTYLSRPDRGRLKKAGNLAFGYAQSSGDVIAVFDADFAPRPEYLLELMPYMDDDKIGIVQSPQYFQTHGLTSWLQRAAGATQELFYRWVQPSRDAIDAPICVGTCALYRRAALASAGGFAQIEHSEDVHTGVKLLGAGYFVRYVPIVVSKGECPDSITAFMSQQYRWCAGSMSLMLNSNFRKMKLTWKQRLCFWSGFGYYITTALAAFAALIPPIFLLWFEPQAIRPENYLWLVPAVLIYPLTMLMNSSDWRFNVVRVQLIYAYCHAVSIWDTYRGSMAEWVATGAAKKTHLTTKITRLMITWIVLTQGLLWGGVIEVLATGALPLSQLWPLILLSAFSAYIQVPLLWMTRRSPAPRPRPAAAPALAPKAAEAVR